MESNHKKALIVAFYLSKYNLRAYEFLELGNMTESHKSIGKTLDVNPNTVKNMRDEFDSVFDNGRKGWWQNRLSKTRMQTMEKFDSLEEESLREIVLNILTDQKLEKESELGVIIDSINDNDLQRSKFTYSPQRGKTGQFAENYFIKNYNKIFYENKIVDVGKLTDKRAHGCGYDFEMKIGSQKKYIEIKGLAAEQGGIMFTDKEWSHALKYGEDYILIVIKNISTMPKAKLIINPTTIYPAKKQIQQVVQVNWIVNSI